MPAVVGPWGGNVRRSYDSPAHIAASKARIQGYQRQACRQVPDFQSPYPFSELSGYPGEGFNKSGNRVCFGQRVCTRRPAHFEHSQGLTTARRRHFIGKYNLDWLVGIVFCARLDQPERTLLHEGGLSFHATRAARNASRASVSMPRLAPAGVTTVALGLTESRSPSTTIQPVPFRK